MTRKRLPVLAVLAGICLIIAQAPEAHAAHPAYSQPVTRVGIVLFDGVEPIDYTGPYEVFAQAGFGVATVSADGKAVTGMGLKIAPDYSFADAPKFDILVVPGGDIERARHDPALLAFIRQQSAHARQVLSVCTGTYILAATGVLDGLEATTFTEAVPDLAASYPKVHVREDARWVDNGKVVTSAGLTTGIDAALNILAKMRGVDVARSIAMRMEYAWQPDPKAGFVRGDMADTHLPDLQHVSWPKDANLEPILSLGDTRHWRILTHTETKLPPQTLLARIDDAVGRTPGWQRQPNLGPHHWRKLEGGQWIEVSFSSSAVAQDGGYDVGATVQLAQPAEVPEHDRSGAR